MLRGIDISRWQGNINWSAVKSDPNAQFVIVKLGGSDDGLYPDGRAQANVNGVRSLNIPRGFYFYLGGVYSPEVETQHILSLIQSIGGLKDGESIWLDWEESHPNEVEYVRDIAQRLINAGTPIPGIYMSLHRIKTKDWSPVVSLGCGLWVAAWGNNDFNPEDWEKPGSEEWPFWAIWQFSSTGSISGISGRVDLNIFNGTIDQFIKYGQSGAGPVVPESLPTPPVAPTPQNGIIGYTVVAGDTMWDIAGRFGISLEHLKQLNPSAGHPAGNYDNIHVGDVLNVPSPTPVSAPPLPDSPRYDYIVPGDSMSALAARNGLTLARLIELNPDAGHPAGNYDLVYPGDKLRIS